MSRVAVLQAIRPQPSVVEAWVRREAILGRQTGDPSYGLIVWTEHEQVPLGEHDAFVSRRHARLVLEDERLLVQDLGSSSGTFVDGTQLPRAKKGRSGELVALPQKTFELGLGPRCVVRVAVVESALGLSPEQWRRLSPTLSRRDLSRLLEVWRWAQELEQAPDGQLTAQGVEAWFAKGRALVVAFPEVRRELEDSVRRLCLHLLPQDSLEVEEKEPLVALCRGLPARLSAHYLNR